MLWILVLAGTRYWLSCNRKKLTILSLVFLTNFLFWSTIMMDPSSILASLRSTFFQMYKPNGSKTLNGFPLTTGFRSLSLPSLRQWRHDVWPWSCALLSVITTARQVLFFTGSISVSQDIVNEYWMLTNAVLVIVEDPAKKICIVLLLTDSIGSLGKKCVTCFCTAVVHYRWLKIYSHQW